MKIYINNGAIKIIIDIIVIKVPEDTLYEEKNYEIRLFNCRLWPIWFNICL